MVPASTKADSLGAKAYEILVRTDSKPQWGADECRQAGYKGWRSDDAYDDT